MKKITLIAAFSLFIAGAAFAQTQDNSNAPAPEFKKISSSIQPEQNNSNMKTDVKDVKAAGQNEVKTVQNDKTENTDAGVETSKFERVSTTAVKASPNTVAPNKMAPKQDAIKKTDSPK